MVAAQSQQKFQPVCTPWARNREEGTVPEEENDMKDRNKKQVSSNLDGRKSKQGFPVYCRNKVLGIKCLINGISLKTNKPYPWT